MGNPNPTSEKSTTSVIAKMKLDGVLDFGSGALSKLFCVCENDLMAAYAKSDEDRLFTKYSPWGEMKLGHKFVTVKGNPKFENGQTFYVIVLRSTTGRPTCKGAEHVHPASCPVVHDFGSSKQIELLYQGPARGQATGLAESPGEFHWKMTIDNPPAVAFFEPGKSGYWVAFYDADKFTMRQALDDAHAAE